MTAVAPITDANPTVAEMEACVARFRSLQPTGDYLDSVIPGCERTTYRVLGEPPAAPLAAADFASEPAYLMGMASGRDPGRIDWPAEVRAAALAVGVTLP